MTNVLQELLKEIDGMRDRLSRRPNSWWSPEPSRQLPPSSLPGPVRTRLEQLRKLDSRAKKLKQDIDAVKAELIAHLGDHGTLDTAAVRGQTWRHYVVRETDEAKRERLDGTAEARRKKLSALLALRDRVLVAADQGSPLEPLLREFRRLCR